MNKHEQMEPMAILKKYNNLGECILTSIVFKNYGSVIELKFNNIYDDSGVIRGDLSKELPLVLRFTLIQEFHYNAALGRGLIEDLSQINWGHWEVASVRIMDDPMIIDKYAHLSKQFHHVAICWEDEQRIDIVYHNLEVFELKKDT